MYENQSKGNTPIKRYYKSKNKRNEDNYLITITNHSERFTKIISPIFQRVRYISTFTKNRKNAIFEFRRGNGNEGSEIWKGQIMAQGKRSTYIGEQYKWTPEGWYKREFGLALHLINLSYSRSLVFFLFPLSPFLISKLCSTFAPFQSDFTIAFLRILQEVNYCRSQLQPRKRLAFPREKYQQ